MTREGLDRWLAVVEAQLDAARRVDPAALSAATEARRHIQDQLSRQDPNKLDPESRAYATEVAHLIRSFDLRIKACGAHVLAAIEAVAPSSAPRTYGRRGLMRGV